MQPLLSILKQDRRASLHPPLRVFRMCETPMFTFAIFMVGPEPTTRTRQHRHNAPDRVLSEVQIKLTFEVHAHEKKRL